MPALLCLTTCHDLFQGAAHRTAKGFDTTEELIGMRLAARQRDRGRLAAGVSGERRDPVPVEVVALGDRPVECDPVRADGARAQRKGLVHRQQVVLVDRQRGNREQQQQQRCQGA